MEVRDSPGSDVPAAPPKPALGQASPPSAQRSGGRTWRPSGLLFCDLLTIAAVLVLSFAFARPLVEEWALANYWHTYGVEHYVQLAHAWPLRPFQAIPSAMAWLIGGRAITGFALAFALVSIAKYLAMRWAVGRFVTTQATWLLATMALVLLPWVALWRMRYTAASLAAALLFVAVGALLRNGDRLTVRWTALGAAATAMMLASYQGPALCSLLLPFVVVAGMSDRPGPRPSTVRRLAIAATPVAAGWALYALYGAVVVRLVGSAGYEGRIADANPDLLNVTQLLRDVRWLYETAYGHVPLTLPLLLASLIAVLGPVLSAIPVRASQLRWAVGLGASVLLLPLLGFSYAALPALLLDPDRVSLAIGTGFTLLAVTALLRFAPNGAPVTSPAVAARPLGRLVVPGIVIGLAGWAILLGNQNRQDYLVVDSVTSQAADVVKASGATTVVLKDWSGTLGDVYSLYPSIVFPALVAHGAPVTKAVLCTPPDVERYAPYARQLRWPTTERCDKVPAITPEPLRLDVVQVPGGGLRVLAPGEPAPVSP